MCGPAAPPDNYCQEGTTPSGIAPPMDYGAPGSYAVAEATFANPLDTIGPPNPGDITVFTPVGETDVPVIFFSHAFAAINVNLYRPLLEMLASHGFAVVFVPYPIGGGADGNETKYAWLDAGFVEAAAQFPTVFDLTRVGFVGHSFGAGATPEMARLGIVERGWGSAARFMFIIAPWYSWGTGYDTLPTDMLTIVQVYADDDVNDHEIAAQDIWDALPAAMPKQWQVVRSDTCTCALTAGHSVPGCGAGTVNPEAGGTLNAHDRWAVWRRMHAAAAYALLSDAAASDVALGVDRYLGHWVGCEDDRDVTPLEVSAAPAPTACQPYMYDYAARCDNADVGYPCP